MWQKGNMNAAERLLSPSGNTEPNNYPAPPHGKARSGIRQAWRTQQNTGARDLTLRVQCVVFLVFNPRNHRSVWTNFSFFSKAAHPPPPPFAVGAPFLHARGTRVTGPPMPSPLGPATTANRLRYLAILATTVFASTRHSAAFVGSFAAALSTKAASRLRGGQQQSASFMMGSPPLGDEEKVVIVGGGIGEKVISMPLEPLGRGTFCNAGVSRLFFSRRMFARVYRVAMYVIVDGPTLN